MGVRRGPPPVRQYDFQPDYLYVSRFIRRRQGERPSPVFCFTGHRQARTWWMTSRHFEAPGASLARLEGGSAGRT